MTLKTTKLVECVPNFSEGRDKMKVDAIVGAAASVEGVRILDVEMDKDHHRCVLTFIGPPEDVLEAAFRAAATARQVIDMNKHKGEHPRIGAADVIPFIPVSGVAMDDCVRLARKLGDRIGRELDIPVYLYGHAATRIERRDLAAVRKGQFEGLRAAIESDPERSPDYGPLRLHPTAGATAIGAREQIVNFNANLDLTAAEAGKAIAKKIRTSGGGLPELRAKEIQLSSGNIQISTVLTDYKRTGLRTVFEAIRREAAAKGGKVVSTEIVGLVPRAALAGLEPASLSLQGFDPKAQVLEEKLEAAGGVPSPAQAPAPVEPAKEEGAVSSAAPSWQEAARIIAEALSSPAPTPGGGSAAAVTGAMGAALAQMAAGISLRSKKLDAARKPALEKACDEFARAREKFLRLCKEDAAAFEAFMDALRASKDQPGRKESLQRALYRAAEVPMDTALLAAQTQLKAVEILPLCVESVASDLRCSLQLLRSAAYCGAENVRVNAQSFSDKAAAQAMEKQLKKILAGMA